VRNVFTKSPSPQTIIPGKRLNHFSFGTSGSVSSSRQTIQVGRQKSHANEFDQANDSATPAEDLAAGF